MPAKRSTTKAPAKRPTRVPKRPKIDESAADLALAIVAAGLDKKAVHAEIIDVRGKVDYTDFVVVMSGRSDRQVQAIARGIEESVQRQRGTRCLAVEGLPHATWVLMDYSDVIVHVFHQDMRGHYDLESLWIDAARLQIPEAEVG